MSQGTRDKAYITFTIFGTSHFFRFYCILFIRRVVRVFFLVKGACILITYLDVAVFASGLLNAFVVDVVEYGEESEINIIPALVTYVI